jgi:hypothetical protein
VKNRWLDNRCLEKTDKIRVGAYAKDYDLSLVHRLCRSPEFDHPGKITEKQVLYILMEVAYAEKG